MRVQGHPVVGVEFVDSAIARMFTGDANVGMADTGLTVGPFKVWAPSAPVAFPGNGDVSVLQGSWFDATPSTVGTFAAAWDVASLVAVDPAVRKQYAAVLTSLLEPGGRVLLCTVVYDQALTPGPPFSTTGQAVEELFGLDFDITLVDSAPTTVHIKFPARTEVRLLVKKGGSGGSAAAPLP